MKDYTTSVCTTLNIQHAVEGMFPNVDEYLDEISRRTKPVLGGRIHHCLASSLIAVGLDDHVGVGDICRVERHGSRTFAEFDDESAILAEVVGFGEGGVRLVAYDEVGGVRYGAKVRPDAGMAGVWPSGQWLGRVIDPMAEPLDGAGPLPKGPRYYPLQARPDAAFSRMALGGRIDLGVRAMNLFTPCCAGQRLGIFAGSGVGKSSLLSMIAQRTDADALVIGLVGERGREVGEFLERTLGEAGRLRSVVVVATSDQPAMLRRRAAYLTLTIAEALRDEGKNVLCLVDSVTRFATALREIYLAAGEMPATRGYPPSVFAELPKLLERAGPGTGAGTITGLFSVLVEGDDEDEPVSDAVRGILDGHVMLSRAIAESGHFPAIDVLRSISRSAPACYDPAERALVQKGRSLLRSYADMAELIQLGAYRAGSDRQLDEAILRRPAIEALLRQDLDESWTGGQEFSGLARALGETEAMSPRTHADG